MLSALDPRELHRFLSITIIHSGRRGSFPENASFSRIKKMTKTLPQQKKSVMAFIQVGAASPFSPDDSQTTHAICNASAQPPLPSTTEDINVQPSTYPGLHLDDTSIRNRQGTSSSSSAAPPSTCSGLRRGECPPRPTTILSSTSMSRNLVNTQTVYQWQHLRSWMTPSSSNLQTTLDSARDDSRKEDGGAEEATCKTKTNGGQWGLATWQYHIHPIHSLLSPIRR